MDKILSARIDELVIKQVGILAHELNTSKKAVIEAAIKMYSKQTGLEKQTDVLKATCGTWKRSETPKENILTARSAFNKSMNRHHQ
ncbi:hypothetical protein [Desulfobacula sp.]